MDRVPLDNFNLSLNPAKELLAIGQNLSQITDIADDPSNILRASWVMAVSALDFFIHEIVRFKMLEIYKGNRNPTNSYNSFSISLSDITHVLNDPNAIDWLDNAIRESHSWRSFQHPDKIAEAIRLISPISLWVEVSQRMGMNSSDIKQTLNAIVDRRNKIAHEADIDPITMQNWPISVVQVRETLDFIEQLAKTIFELM